jgi:hypothetical protein
MTELGCVILLPRLFNSNDEGREFLRLLLRHLPDHVPERCGCDEPLKVKFSADDLETALAQWGPYGFTATRRKPRLYLDVWFSQESLPEPRHAKISVFHFEASDWAHVSAFETLVTDVATTFDAHFAAAHIFTQCELTEWIDYLRTRPGSNPGYIARKAEKQGLASTLDGITLMQYAVDKKLRLYLPNLPWLTILGEPYINLFGRKRVESTPAHEVRRLQNGSIRLKVTPDIPDTPEGWADFKAVRDGCKSHLDSNAFFDPAAPRGHVYRAPDFRFPD